MKTAAEEVTDMIFLSKWSSQTLCAGAELGVFDCLSRDGTRTAGDIAAETGLDPALLYRLLRALASLGPLHERLGRHFNLTERGAVLRTDAPGSLRYMAMLEGGPEHWAIWNYVPAMVRDGRQNAFMREYGEMAFAHARANPDGYGAVFGRAMSGFSAIQSAWALVSGQGVSQQILTDDFQGMKGEWLDKFPLKNPGAVYQVNRSRRPAGSRSSMMMRTVSEANTATLPCPRRAQKERYQDLLTDPLTDPLTDLQFLRIPLIGTIDWPLRGQAHVLQKATDRTFTQFHFLLFLQHCSNDVERPQTENQLKLPWISQCDSLIEPLHCFGTNLSSLGRPLRRPSSKACQPPARYLASQPKIVRCGTAYTLATTLTGSPRMTASTASLRFSYLAAAFPTSMLLTNIT